MVSTTTKYRNSAAHAPTKVEKSSVYPIHELFSGVFGSFERTGS